MTASHSVIIAGAGPVGLLLACELALAGHPPLVLERDASPSSPWKEKLGLRGLFLPAVEAFYRRDLLDQVTQTSAADRPTHFTKTDKPQFAGHFAGISLDGNKIDFSRWKYHLPGPAAMPGRTTLGHLESVLTERALALGVRILRGKPVTRILEQGDVVEVWSNDESFTASWLVGCDGGRSAVRRLAGFTMSGTEAEFTGYIAQCELDKPELLKAGFARTGSGMYINMANTVIYIVDMDTSFDRSREVTKDQFQTALRRVSRTDVGVTAMTLSTSFTDRSKQATEYRRGRVLLAGDAAHIHSPLGAQGLSTGIGDAINLGWKLGAVIQGTASPGLLDSYFTERHPIAAAVLEWTRAQVATLRTDGSGSAVAKLVTDLIATPDGTTYFVDRIWGLSLRYDLGGGQHDLLGHSVPDLEFEGGGRLGERMEKGKFVLVDLDGHVELEDFAKSVGPEVEYVASRATDALGLKALLVRPDGVVAWLTEDKIELDALREALGRWLSLPGLRHVNGETAA